MPLAKSGFRFLHFGNSLRAVLAAALGTHFTDTRRDFRDFRAEREVRKQSLWSFAKSASSLNTLLESLAIASNPYSGDRTDAPTNFKMLRGRSVLAADIPDLTSEVPARLVARNRNAQVEQHELCRTCERIIGESKIINGRAGELPQPGKPRNRINGFDNFFRGDVVERVDHHRMFSRLTDAAVDGCHLCSLLVHKVYRAENQPSGGSPSIQARVPPDAPLLFRISCSISPYRGRIMQENGVIELYTRSPDGTEKDCHVSLRIHQYAGDKYGDGRDKTYDYHRTAPSGFFTLSTSSSSSFATAAEWLQNCQKYHATCNESYASATNSPTRLLVIEKTGNSYSVRLTSTHKDQSERPSYLTLSHRWGKVPTLRLLESNAHHFSQGISFEALPPTFRDAVVLTAGLGFRHLWIDSLCIVQNSLVDWERESTMMGEIYRGSVCTIAASGAQDCHDGLFSVRYPLLYTPCRLTEKVGVDGVYAHPSTDTLSSRGWIVQERALAPRTLFFHRGCISWECVALTYKESGEEDAGDQLKSRLYGMLNSKIPDFDIDTLPDSSLTLFMIFWARIVELYSRTSLTVPSDKLVAIHGVMTRIQSSEPRLTGVAGLWKELLPAELLWQTDRKTWPSHEPVREYRAPSWSWAAVESPISITWPKKARDLLDLRARDFPSSASKYSMGWQVSVLEVDVVSLPNGQVSSAHIKLEGPLRQVQGSRRALDAHDVLRLEEYSWVPDEGNPSKMDELWALLVSRTMGAGLILEPVSGREMTFRRKGYFHHGSKAPQIFDAKADMTKFLSTLVII